MRTALSHLRRLLARIASRARAVFGGTSASAQPPVEPPRAETQTEVRELVAERTVTLADEPRTSVVRVRYVGDYELLAELGRGGMGVVYRARQVSLDRVVAVKMLPSGPDAPASELARFRREAEAAAALDHPAIVPIYEIGSHEGAPYFSMKLVEGRSLAAALRAGSLSVRAAVRTLARVAQAVHYAHRQGIIHRDLKPQNVLLDARGEPYVADFGLAKRDRGRELTHTGAILGTPAYMAPEQAGFGRYAVGTLADVYALGAILYEILTGSPPHGSASTPELLAKLAVGAEPTRASRVRPGVDADLETIAAKALDSVPAQRYGSAEALADELDRWLEYRPILTRPLPRHRRLAKWARRRPAIAVLLAMLSIILVAGGAAMASLWRRGESARDEAEVFLYEAGLRNAAMACGTSTREAHRILDALDPARRDWAWMFLKRSCPAPPGEGVILHPKACAPDQVWTVAAGSTVAAFCRTPGELDVSITDLPSGRVLADDVRVPLGSDPLAMAWTVAVQPDSAVVAVSTGAEVLAFDAGRRSTVRRFVISEVSKVDNTVAADANVLAARDGRRVNVWNTLTGRLLGTCSFETRGGYSLALHASNKLNPDQGDVWLAGTAVGGELRFCDVRTGRIELAGGTPNRVLAGFGVWAVDSSRKPFFVAPTEDTSTVLRLTPGMSGRSRVAGGGQGLFAALASAYFPTGGGAVVAVVPGPVISDRASAAVAWTRTTTIRRTYPRQPALLTRAADGDIQVWRFDGASYETWRLKPAIASFSSPAAVSANGRYVARGLPDVEIRDLLVPGPPRRGSLLPYLGRAISPSFGPPPVTAVSQDGSGFAVVVDRSAWFGLNGYAGVDERVAIVARRLASHGPSGEAWTLPLLQLESWSPDLSAAILSSGAETWLHPGDRRLPAGYMNWRFAEDGRHATAIERDGRRRVVLAEVAGAPRIVGQYVAPWSVDVAQVDRSLRYVIAARASEAARDGALAVFNAGTSRLLRQIAGTGTGPWAASADDGILLRLDREGDSLSAWSLATGGRLFELDFPGLQADKIWFERSTGRLFAGGNGVHLLGSELSALRGVPTASSYAAVARAAVAKANALGDGSGEWIREASGGVAADHEAALKALPYTLPDVRDDEEPVEVRRALERIVRPCGAAVRLLGPPSDDERVGYRTLTIQATLVGPPSAISRLADTCLAQPNSPVTILAQTPTPGGLDVQLSYVAEPYVDPGEDPDEVLSPCHPGRESYSSLFTCYSTISQTESARGVFPNGWPRYDPVVLDSLKKWRRIAAYRRELRGHAARLERALQATCGPNPESAPRGIPRCGPVAGPSDPLDVVRARLRSPDALVRTSAAWELAGAVRLDSEAVRDLARASEDPFRPVREAATWALCHGSDARRSYQEAVAPNDSPPRITSQPPPRYPSAAASAGIEGTVQVFGLIDEDGRIAKAVVRRSIPELDQAALDAVSSFTFEPARKGSRTVASCAQFPVTFKIGR